MHQQIVEEYHGCIIFRHRPHARDNSRIAPCDRSKLLVFERIFIYGVLLFINGRRGLDSKPHYERRAVGQAARDASRLVGVENDFPVFRVHLVVVPAPGHVFYRHPCAHFHGFYCTDAEHFPQLSVEFVKYGFSESHGQSCCNDFHHAAERVRESGLPYFVEATTYRFRGHSMADPGKYRSAAEHELWKSRDPIPNLAKRLLEEGIADRQALDAIKTRCKAQVEEAVQFAEQSPWPEDSEVYNDIYV